MKILHIATSDSIGGAAIAAFRLNEAMNKAGVSSTMLVANKQTKSLSVINAFKGLSQICYYLYSGLLGHLIFKYLNPYYTFSAGYGYINILKYKIVFESDIIYIHWINDGFLGIKSISKLLKTGKPIVMVMHDMWNITGGCHHSFECLQYTTTCNTCPIIQNRKFSCIVKKIYNKKKKWKPYPNLMFMTPSSWLSDCVRRSGLFKEHNVTIIPNMIDTSKFKPCDKRFARKMLGLDLTKKIILFGANGGNSNPYKGWNYLKESLKHLELNDVEILLFGSEISTNKQKELLFPIHTLGYLSDSYSLSLMYNAADVYIQPSLAEVFGLTIAESMSCGTFVVGFDVGGIPDLIKHKRTGYLAAFMDSKDLARGIMWALDNTSKKNSNFLHNFICSNFSYKEGVKKHINYCKEII